MEDSLRRRTGSGGEIVVLVADRHAMERWGLDAATVLAHFLGHFSTDVTGLSIDREPLQDVVSRRMETARSEIISGFGVPSNRPLAVTEVQLDVTDPDDRQLFAGWAYGSLLADVWGRGSRELFEASDAGSAGAYYLPLPFAERFLATLVAAGFVVPEDWRAATARST